MEIYKELQTPASKEFEKLLNSQLSKNKIEEGKIVEGKVAKITDKFVIPEILIAVTSSVFLIFKKNHIPDNKIMNGSIVCSKLGTLSVDSNKGIWIPISMSLKKFISSNKFITIPKQKKIKIILATTLINSFARYLFIIKDLSIIFKISFHV